MSVTPTTRATVGARRDRLLAELARIAREGGVCPDNIGLGVRLGEKAATVHNDMHYMRCAGVIDTTSRHPRVVTICATGARTAAPKPNMNSALGRIGRRNATQSGLVVRMRAKAAGKTTREYMAGADGGVISDGVLYGDLAHDVAFLRRRGHHVYRSDTVGGGVGRYIIDNRVVTPDELAAWAARIRARVTPMRQAAE